MKMVSIVNFEHVIRGLVCCQLSLDFTNCSGDSIIDFKQVNADWGGIHDDKTMSAVN